MKIEQLSVNTIRMLAADAVEKAQTGHAGTPMGMAPVAYVLFHALLRHNPRQPDWINRDRFVLSSGHASLLLYAALHLCGYDLPLQAFQTFRRHGSLATGHPERGHTVGVEVSTGPLGQGFANAVGMAMAEAHLAACYNRADLPPLVDHYTYVLVSDGDLMEGISSEAASLAGHLKLGKLIAIYDDNQVTIEGATDLTFTEDRLKRFEAYHWHVQSVADANDLESLHRALEQAKAVTDRPSLISVRSVIGYGSPGKQGTSGAHSGALGSAELAATRQALGWESGQAFFVPDEVRQHFAPVIQAGERAVSAWQAILAQYQTHYPEMTAEFQRRMSGTLPAGWDNQLPAFTADAKGMATRQANPAILRAAATPLPELMGGSADLAPSNLTHIEGQADFSAANYAGRVLHFGVREHAMGSICNCMSAHGGILPFCATYLSFSDYMRPSIRMSALMKLRTLFVFTHDSIAVGEDGPTHQPVEQIIGLRAIPDVTVIRPCDANEAVEAWRYALSSAAGTTCLILSRQKLPVLDRQHYAPADGLQRGAYILSDAHSGVPEMLIIATGSEVALALQAQIMLAERGIDARVVSMPSWELFRRQESAYQQSVLPPEIEKRIAIEAGSTLGWERWVGLRGAVIGVDQFGMSSPAETILEQFQISAERIVELALGMV